MGELFSEVWRCNIQTSKLSHLQFDKMGEYQIAKDLTY